MKASPVQLVQLMFKHVRVEMDPEHPAPQMINPLTDVFTFEGVNLSSEVGIGEADMNHERGRVYFVELRAVVDNVPNPASARQQFAPYKIDVAVEGLILIPKGAEAVADPEDLAAVNGASSVNTAPARACSARLTAGTPSAAISAPSSASRSW